MRSYTDSTVNRDVPGTSIFAQMKGNATYKVAVHSFALRMTLL